jgi:hypothetical protein
MHGLPIRIKTLKVRALADKGLLTKPSFRVKVLSRERVQSILLGFQAALFLLSVYRLGGDDVRFLLGKRS